MSDTGTILLIEDEPRVACALALMITQLGWAVRQANSIERARQALLEDRSVEIIIADYGMNSAQTGLDLLEWAAEHRPEASRVLISGLDLRRMHTSIDEICQAFLPKPFDLRELREVLEALEG